MKAALTALGEQLAATSQMTWQNKQALDWLLAERGGVCVMFGSHCYTFKPNNTAPSGAFSKAMRKLKDLKAEVKPNAGRDKHMWDWFDLFHWRIIGKAGLMIVGCLVVFVLLGCCVVPIVRAFITKTISGQMVIRPYKNKVIR